MGMWGAGLYQSDVALDARGLYRDGRGLGFSGERLAALVETELGDVEGPDAAIGRLVLAEQLWRDGWLDPPRRDAAITLAGTIEGLEFDTASLERAHARMLATLADRLAAPQRSPRPSSAEPYVEQSELEPGEALAIADGAGRWWLLRVVTFYTRFGGRSPVVEVLDWRGTQLPDAASVEGLTWRRQADAVVIGAAHPEQTVAGLIALGRLPARARWDDYEAQMAAPHIPVIRTGDRDPGYRSMVRLGVSVPATRPFTSDWFIASNAWTRWKDLVVKLEGYYREWPGAEEEDALQR